MENETVMMVFLIPGEALQGSNDGIVRHDRWLGL